MKLAARFALPALPTPPTWTAIAVAGAFADQRLWAHPEVLAITDDVLGDDAVIHSVGIRPSAATPPQPAASSPYTDAGLPAHALLLHIPSGPPAIAVAGAPVTTPILQDARLPIAGLGDGAPALEILYTRPWFVDPTAPTPCLRMPPDVYRQIPEALRPLWARVGSLLARAKHKHSLK